VKGFSKCFPVLWKHVLGYFQAKAVNMVADGTAPVIPQPDEGASYEPSLGKEELQMASILKNTSLIVRQVSVVQSREISLLEPSGYYMYH
jgi:hypothetical protein